VDGLSVAPRYALSLAACPEPAQRASPRHLQTCRQRRVLQWTRGVALAGRTTRLDRERLFSNLHPKDKFLSSHVALTGLVLVRSGKPVL